MSNRPLNCESSHLGLKNSMISLSFVGITLLLGACGRESEQITPDEATTPALAPTSALPRTESPAGARVFFANLADGDIVPNPVEVQFGIVGMTVVKAGMDEPQSGHHHLIIDAALPELSFPIPVSENYVHFGDGSKRTERTLEPGTHTLQMLLGDHLHIPHDPPVMSEVITIVVE